jgi:hypothetical protein
MARSQVKGASEINRAINAMSRGVTPAEVRKAHDTALKPMQANARQTFTANGSFVTGVIPRSIVIAHTAPNETKIGLVGNGAKLGHFIEFGTAPHYQPQRRQEHPGATPKPFLRPAFENTNQESLRIAGGAYGSLLLRIARANARGRG